MISLVPSKTKMHDIKMFLLAYLTVVIVVIYYTAEVKQSNIISNNGQQQFHN